MKRVVIGMDVGSTTVKAVVVDPETLEIRWRDYRRHETRQPETVRDFLIRIGNAFPDAEDVRIFMTGSGAGPLAAPLGGRFVQEVNALVLAVERLHPDASSIVELGGQDAKIVVFRERTLEDGRVEKQAVTSMNDKCASGTGATIDKCMIKVGADPDHVQKMRFDAGRLHHVAAKCGVFAETDIVNLVKSGIPSDEILCSLADAIVMQNLSVLTRGNTLKAKVVLLGGPNNFLPFLVDCWRMRIPETWRERAYTPPEGPIEDLIVVPDGSVYYAAYGAVVYGMTDADAKDAGRYAGLAGLDTYLKTGRDARLTGQAGQPLVHSEEELREFLAQYTIPPFEPARFTPGSTVRAVVGLDGGSTSTKAVLVDHDSGEVIVKAYRISKGNPIQDTKEILAELREHVHAQGAHLEVTGFGATGYAAAVLEESLHADVNVVETVAHLMSAVRYVPDADVICDIGGQDIKVLFLAENLHGTRDVKDFRLSNQCSAGNGMLLQAMADQFGVALPDYADVAFSAPLSPKFSYGCAVFLDADRVNFQKEGFTAPEMLAGLAQVLPKNVWQYVVQVPRLAEFGRVFVLQGGTQRNLAAVKAQVDYIHARVPDAKVVLHPHCGEAGAIGAAMETLRVVRQRGKTRWVGLDAAIGLHYTTTTDETTRCTFCPNLCSRTFVDTRTPDGQTSRYISGFSCEKGTVESASAVREINKRRAQLRRQFPNLVEVEADLAFDPWFPVEPLPQDGALKDDVVVQRTWSLRAPLGRIVRKALKRGFRRSYRDLSAVRIGIPRVLNLYSVAPFFSAYFRTLGLPADNLVFSPQTNEEMFLEGARYGSVDPCFPSKVVQAHIHALLHLKEPLKYLYFPCITHVPTWVTPTMDNTSCPIVAGAPNVTKAAFTKEVDFFVKNGVEYIDRSITFNEPHLLRKHLFETWGARLGVTQDESDFAVEQGFAALRAFDDRLQQRGKEVLEQVEREDRVAILMIGRPYHSDPGLHHGIPDELQILGYPILSIRSVPKDREWLKTYFGDTDPHDINDVWPENFSANSAQKVWAARFAARHPNVAVLDLSSFKCGHDAPTYGLIDNILHASRTPYAALHDIDANKPGGSIAIRTRTYAHRLDRVREALIDASHKRAELARRVAERRAELLARLDGAAAK